MAIKNYGGCFKKNSKILLNDYSYKDIELIRKGDKIITYN